jgi:hypothetical protein
MQNTQRQQPANGTFVWSELLTKDQKPRHRPSDTRWGGESAAAGREGLAGGSTIYYGPGMTDLGVWATPGQRDPAHLRFWRNI